MRARLWTGWAGNWQPRTLRRSGMANRAGSAHWMTGRGPARRQPGRPIAGPFDQIATAVCARFGLPVATLYGDSRQHEVVTARAAVAAHAVRLNICSMSDAARRMGRAPGTVSAAITALRQRDPTLLSDCGI
ncbi:MAG: hypothetical protein FJ191_03635 [Gammaproteobacteria bacterium]|nr:hypothetical protein [Gammaproteobacteria bacterium]